MTQFYIPEYHSFKYRAWAPWPHTDEGQMDWINSLTTVEDWLIKYVGPHYKYWAWDRVDLACQGHYLGVAFEHDKHRGLFLLRWGC